MFVLTVNTGSSSVRLALYAREAKDLRACGHAHYESDAGDPRARLQAFLDRHAGERPRLVAHRVVHGGAHLTSTRRIDAEVEAEIERLAPLAPLHNPVALAWIRVCREALGTHISQVAVFDTAFYAQLPEVAATYALPRELSARHRLRRYGFHGLAHQALWSRWRELRPDVSAGGRVISFHLGAGCSVTAIDRGRALDTSMGFSPLEGLMMATRSGDVDPGLVTFLQRVEGMSAPDVEQLLNERSGLLGVSGTSGDMRQLLGTDDPHARLAVQLYCYRARKYLGAYLTVLGGADAILFGGGVGENAAAVRAGILEGLDWAGIRLDAAANAATTGREGRISAADSRIEAWVIPVDEARILAREALATVIL
ncbi:MAG: acetate/propionate family kinase [Betaproteobacteria bacterium]|nr:acetate/propionate family kinase [Betaproteobacteria bacterium]